MNASEAPDEFRDETIVVECDLSEPPEMVWRALTTPEIVTEWLMPGENLRAEKGARFEFGGASQSHDSRADKRDDRGIQCEVLAAEPLRLLQYKWREERQSTGDAPQGDGVLQSVVTFVLSGTPSGGTHLRVVHGDFELTAQEPATLLEPTMLAGHHTLRFARARIQQTRRRRSWRATTESPRQTQLHALIRRAA